MPKVGSQQVNGLVDTFKSLPEHRKNLLNIDHKLHDIVAIAVLAVIAGADGPTDIDQWAATQGQRTLFCLKFSVGGRSSDQFQ